MIRDKSSNSQGRTRLSPSPKPISRERQTSLNSRQKQHKRTWTFANKVQTQSEISSQLNSSLTMINHKIKNILDSFQMYENCTTPLQILKNNPYVQDTMEIKMTPKREKHNRKEDKENQNSNQVKEFPKKFKSFARVLQQTDINRQDNKPRSYVQGKQKPRRHISQDLQVASFHYEQEKPYEKLQSQTSIIDCKESVKSVKRPKILSKMRKSSLLSSQTTLQTVETDIQCQSSNQKHRFLQLLQAQVELDQKFRKAKQWFKQYRKDHKWWLLERELKKNRLWVNQLSMKTVFMISLKQQNPFQDNLSSQHSIKHLVSAFKQAQQHWLINIKHNFELKSLKRQAYFIGDLDPRRKGHIQLYDLIRFMNTHLDTFYSHRQLQLIYLRLRQRDNLQYFDLVHAISKSIL